MRVSIMGDVPKGMGFGPAIEHVIRGDLTSTENEYAPKIELFACKWIKLSRLVHDPAYRLMILLFRPHQFWRDRRVVDWHIAVVIVHVVVCLQRRSAPTASGFKVATPGRHPVRL
jgi:hypothetical protein